MSGVSPEMVASLHRRASVWFERQGFVAEAVQHALMTADGARVADLIEQHGLGVMLGGQVTSVLSWLNALPDSLISTRPLLCLVHASGLRFTNQSEAAEARLKDAERCIQDDTPPEQADFIKGRVASIRANIARYTGDLTACVSFAKQALRLLPETQVVARTFSQLNIARAFRVSGDVTDASERDAVAVVGPIRASGNLVGTLVAVANLAWLQVLQGRLRTAAATYHEMPQISSGPDNLQVLLGGVAYYAGLGDLLREWNDLDAASQHLAQAMDLLKGTLAVDAEDVVYGYLALARLQHARGEYANAKETLASLSEVAHQRRFVAPLITRVVAMQAQFALATGDLPAAIAWADRSGLRVDDVLRFPREVEYLVLTRTWIAQAEKHPDDGVLPQAFTLLDRLLQDATAKGRQSSVLDILIVRALAYWAQGAHGDALLTLERALRLAAPEGFIRRFVDEGPVMAAMLHAANARGIAPDYVTGLLAAFPVSDKETSRQGAKEIEQTMVSSVSRSPGFPVSQFMIEPLSARELEVLRLIANGKSNAEVARTLMIAISTVKTHTNSIFGKLQVTSRTQAIALARDLQLL
jgi:LuxR family maltose regulon positive regulatory protein